VGLPAKCFFKVWVLWWFRGAWEFCLSQKHLLDCKTIKWCATRKNMMFGSLLVDTLWQQKCQCPSCFQHKTVQLCVRLLSCVCFPAMAPKRNISSSSGRAEILVLPGDGSMAPPAQCPHAADNRERAPVSRERVPPAVRRRLTGKQGPTARSLLVAWTHAVGGSPKALRWCTDTPLPAKHALGCQASVWGWPHLHPCLACQT